MEWEAAGVSINKVLFLCRFVAAGHGVDNTAPGHGDLEEVGDHVVCCCVLNLWQGSDEAAPGSASTAALLWLPSKMVERRPLPPSSSASVPSGRRLQVKFNLQADMPNRRPLCSVSVGSWSLTPSNFVPGGEVLDYAALRRCCGAGARPDRVCNLSSRVLTAKKLDLSVISTFLGSVLACLEQEVQSILLEQPTREEEEAQGIHLEQAKCTDASPTDRRLSPDLVNFLLSLKREVPSIDHLDELELTGIFPPEWIEKQREEHKETVALYNKIDDEMELHQAQLRKELKENGYIKIKKVDDDWHARFAELEAWGKEQFAKNKIMEFNDSDFED